MLACMQSTAQRDVQSEHTHSEHTSEARWGTAPAGSASGSAWVGTFRATCIRHHGGKPECLSRADAARGSAGAMSGLAGQAVGHDQDAPKEDQKGASGCVGARDPNGAPMQGLHRASVTRSMWQDSRVCGVPDKSH